LSLNAQNITEEYEKTDDNREGNVISSDVAVLIANRILNIWNSILKIEKNC
jgi:hypothetical protein